MRVGAHESIAGGLVRAFERMDANSGEALQIFTTNGSRWAPQARDPGEIREFAAETARRGLVISAHDSYLINLAAPRGELWTKSRTAFVAELERCEALGVAHVVMHPGAHRGAGTVVGVRRVAANLRWALARTRGYRVRVLVELTAGQGTCLGSTFEELRALLEAIDEPARTGVCFDTCHALAAGYDLRTEAGYQSVWRDFDRLVGLEHLHAFHLNDSKRDLGTRVDRHEQIGKGFVGDGLFIRLMTDPCFADHPAVVELPPEVTKQNLRKLKSFRQRVYRRKA